jgi:16S rRNA (uracil1498-N3)-methyltransferase
MPDNRAVTARFYAPQANRPGDLIELPSDEAAHLARVLRLKAGAVVRLFNGRGGEFDGVVDSVGKSRVHVRLDRARDGAAEPRISLTLAQAVLRGEKMDHVVRDAVMMGVAAILPIVTTRSEVTLATLRRGGRRERWERVAVASAKQCGRALVPAILEPQPFEDALNVKSDSPVPRPALMLVEPAAGSRTIPLGEVARTAPSQATLLVGPEGGWTPDEVDRGLTTGTLVTLGARTLRADAAAVVAIAALFAIWNEL